MMIILSSFLPFSFENIFENIDPIDPFLIIIPSYIISEPLSIVHLQSVIKNTM